MAVGQITSARPDPAGAAVHRRAAQCLCRRQLDQHRRRPARRPPFVADADHAVERRLAGAGLVDRPRCLSDPQRQCGSEEGTPIVYDGVMYYQTAKSDVFALDATTGQILWHFTPTFDAGFKNGTGGRKPGVGIGDGLVYAGLNDGSVVALNQQTGQVVADDPDAVAAGRHPLVGSAVLRRHGHRGDQRRRRRRR